MIPFEDVAMFVICDFETTGVDVKKDLPIEIGAIITDHNLNVLGTYESLIDITDIDNRFFQCAGEPSTLLWSTLGAAAYAVHKISAEEVAKGDNPLYVVNNLNEHIKRHLEFLKKYNKYSNRKKVVLVSDNIQFEYGFMKRLYTELLPDGQTKEWPYHYCGFDSTMLLELTGIGDPKNVPHRALMDASMLHQHLVRAFEKMNYFHV